MTVSYVTVGANGIFQCTTRTMLNDSIWNQHTSNAVFEVDDI
jgi:hypothetical protein